jgi:hypothetical protein
LPRAGALCTVTWQSWEREEVSQELENFAPWFRQQGRSAGVNPSQRKEQNMRRIGLTLAAVAALATTAVATSPAEARGGRNAAIGFGVAAGVLGAAAAASAANNGYYYGPRYGYYGGGPYAYYDDGPRYYRRHHYGYYDAW